MDDADEHKEGEEDLLDIMHVDGESLDKDESSNENDDFSDEDGEEDLVDIMHVDGESLDEDESSNKDDESSVEERIYRFETSVHPVEENYPS